MGDVPVITVTPRSEEDSDFFSEDDVAEVQRFQLDVALRFGFGLLRGGALAMARYGVWAYHHGDDGVRRGGPAGSGKSWKGGRSPAPTCRS